MVAKNLAPIIPAIFTGPGGERLTPDQIKRRQEIAQSLLGQATDASPNAGGWASILSKTGLGLLSGYQSGRAERGETKNAEASKVNLQNMYGSLIGGTPAATAAPAMGGLPAMAAGTGVGAEMAATAPGVAAQTGTGILPPTFLAAVDHSEGAGAYDTLFGHAQKSGPFAGTDVSSMPIRDVLAFADPSGPYGQHVKGKVGRVATPMGRYQIVGTTLRNAVGELGLDPNTPFDAATQDRVALHLAKRRISSADTLDGKISALRSEWEGFKNVPNDQMGQIVAELEASGDAPPMAAQPMAMGTPQGAIEAVAPAAGGQHPAFDAGRFGDPINLAEMPPSASTLPSSLIDQGSSYAPAPPMTAPPREVGSMRVAEALAAQPATAAPAVAPAMSAPPQIAASTLPPINPAVIETLSSPYASPEEKAVAQALLGQHQQKQAQVEAQTLAQQQRQAEIARRQGLAPQIGINPVYAQDDALWEGAAGNIFAAPSTTSIDGRIVDNRTREVIYEAPADAQTYRGYAEYEQSQGRKPLGPLEYEQALRRSGASQTNVDTGTIPTGFQAVRDAEGRLVRYDPVPGGPADTSSKTAAAQEGRERSGGIVLEDVDRAVAAIEENPTLTTGLIGEWTKGIAGTPAKKVENLLQTVRANAAFDRLQQMRDASPTGGALGGVAIEELNLLKNAIGSLEQSNDSEDLVYNLRRVQKIYEDIIHGPEAAAQMREQRKAQSSSSQQQQENPLPPQANGRKTSTGTTWEIIE